MIVGPLEYEPELVAAIGLLMVRWATLEHELAKALGEFTKSQKVGDRIYYTVGSFGQRISMVEAACATSLVYPKHRAVALRLGKLIRRLWYTRSYLVHSHYGYANELGPNPTALQLMGPPHRDGRVEIPGYFTPLGDKMEFTPVNAGTFKNYADQVARRTMQVHRFSTAIARGRVRQMPPAYRGIRN